MSSDVVVVKTEEEVMNYPMAPSSSVIFKIENKPLLFIKTMGISQFDSPTIEKWVKEEKDTQKEEPVVKIDESYKQDLEGMRLDIDTIKDELSDLRDKVLYNKTTKRTAKEVDKND